MRLLTIFSTQGYSNLQNAQSDYQKQRDEALPGLLFHTVDREGEDKFDLGSQQ